MSGLRRAEAPTRANTPIVHRDPAGLVKINPIANWSDLDVAGYIADHDVPVNPLVDQGYPSIGCWPCTQPSARAIPSGPGAGPASRRPSAACTTSCRPSSTHLLRARSVTRTGPREGGAPTGRPRKAT